MCPRRRCAAKILVVNDSGEVLLVRFVHRRGVLAGADYWATPGGGVEEGETIAEARRRELEEETGIRVHDLGPEVGRRELLLGLSDGANVMADERYFRIEISDAGLSRDGLTDEEADAVAEWRWRSPEEIERTSETVWPENLADMLRAPRPSDLDPA